jgi:hypothetical protein
VKFPDDVTALHVADLNASSYLSVSLVCLEVNPYMYVDNADYLVTSGALIAQLKDKNNTEIK